MIFRSRHSSRVTEIKPLSESALIAYPAPPDQTDRTHADKGDHSAGAGGAASPEKWVKTGLSNQLKLRERDMVQHGTAQMGDGKVAIRSIAFGSRPARQRSPEFLLNSVAKRLTQ